MQSIVNKIKENIADRIVEIFWVAVKAAVITAIILVLLQIIPINIQHTGEVGVSQADRSWSVGQSGSWDVDVDQTGRWDVGVQQLDSWRIIN